MNSNETENLYKNHKKMRNMTQQNNFISAVMQNERYF